MGVLSKLDNKHHVFYSARIGVEKDKLTLKDINDVFHVILNELTQGSYFTTFYGEVDNSDNWTPGVAGKNFEAYCLSLLGRRIKDPFYQDQLKYTEVDLFDLIELLHLNIELKWKIAFTEYELEDVRQVKEHSQTIFRDKINMQLSRYGTGWELTRDGYIRELVSAELRELIDNHAHYGDEDKVDSLIRRGIKNFLKYGSDEHSKKAALLEIGNALEIIRPELEIMLPPEETNIFHLLNKFYLRHNRISEERDYDKSIYYPWIFYIFVSTFDAFVKLRQRKI